MNYARKQFYKNEVNEEIRLRSPAQCHRSPRGSFIVLGSTMKRPSVANFLIQVPQLHRNVSEACLLKVRIT